MPKEITIMTFLRACEVLEKNQNLQNVHNTNHIDFHESFQQWGALEKIEWCNLRKSAGFFNKQSENRFKTLDGLFLTPKETKTNLGDVLGNVKPPKSETPEKPKETKTNLGDVLGNVKPPKSETPEKPKETKTNLGDVKPPKSETPEKPKDETVKTPKVDTNVSKHAANISAVLGRQNALKELYLLNRWKDPENIDFFKLHRDIIFAITPVEKFETCVFEGFNLVPKRAMIKLASKGSSIYYSDDAANLYSLLLWNLVMSEESSAENRVALALNVGLCMVAGTKSHIENIFKDLCVIHCAVFGCELSKYERSEMTAFKNAVARVLGETRALAKRDTEMFEYVESKWLQF